MLKFQVLIKKALTSFSQNLSLPIFHFTESNVHLFDFLSISTYNLVVQYSTPSYYHKTFENKLYLIALATKTVFFCTH